MHRHQLQTNAVDYDRMFVPSETPVGLEDRVPLPSDDVSSANGLQAPGLSRNMLPRSPPPPPPTTTTLSVPSPAEPFESSAPPELRLLPVASSSSSSGGEVGDGGRSGRSSCRLFRGGEAVDPDE